MGHRAEHFAFSLLRFVILLRYFWKKKQPAQGCKACKGQALILGLLDSVLYFHNKRLKHTAVWNMIIPFTLGNKSKGKIFPLNISYHQILLQILYEFFREVYSIMTWIFFVIIEQICHIFWNMKHLSLPFALLLLYTFPLYIAHLLYAKSEI